MNRIIWLSLLVVLVSACSSDGEERPEYLDSQSLKALELPPQLTRPNNSEDLQIPEPSAKALAALQQSGSAEGMVAPAFKGVQLKSEQGIYFLELDSDADALWVILRDFWANEGIAVDRDEPLLGLMETKWIKEYQVKSDRDAGFFKRVLSSFSPDVVDKFRFRVERVGKQSRIYVSHRGLHIAITGESSHWALRASDAALEQEILYRLSLFAGMRTQQANALFAAWLPYQSRLSPVSGSDHQFDILGRRELLWPRLQQALDRLGANVVLSQAETGSMVFEIREIPAALLADEDDEEVYDPLDEDKPTTPAVADEVEVEVAIKLQINLSSQQDTTRLSVTDAAGKPVEGGFALDVVQMLATLLK